MYINIKNKENTPEQLVEWRITQNKVVATQRRLLLNDVIFRKKKV